MYDGAKENTPAARNRDPLPCGPTLSWNCTCDSFSFLSSSTNRKFSLSTWYLFRFRVIDSDTNKYDTWWTDVVFEPFLVKEVPLESLFSPRLQTDTRFISFVLSSVGETRLFWNNDARDVDYKGNGKSHNYHGYICLILSSAKKYHRDSFHRHNPSHSTSRIDHGKSFGHYKPSASWD